jgi:hypothetical protein
MAPSPFGHGYWLAAADGTVYPFGGAPNLGSAATSPSAPVVSIASDLNDGYWLIHGQWHPLSLRKRSQRGLHCRASSE